MAKIISGVGRKRPQLNIPIEFLNLDPQNPRLAKESLRDTQVDILRTLYDSFDTRGERQYNGRDFYDEDRFPGLITKYKNYTI
jgi:hypothetical protein